jgi:hypothetical protein
MFRCATLIMKIWIGLLVSQLRTLNQFQYGGFVHVDRCATYSLEPICWAWILSSFTRWLRTFARYRLLVCYLKSMSLLQGLKFMHSSVIQYHGNLKSTNCLIDERWQVKLSDFGLKFLRNHSNQPEEMLWTAPEILRDPLISGSKSGDVYSFGISDSRFLIFKRIWIWIWIYSYFFYEYGYEYEYLKVPI